MDRVCAYTLHGISDDGGREVKNISLMEDGQLNDGGIIIYTLTANRYYYSIYFEIDSAAGQDQVLSDNFSELVTCYVKVICIITH